MSYSSLQACVRDLEKHGHLIRIKEELDPNLEIAEVHRRIFDQKGPAILFERVKGSPFPAVSNLYGTYERTDFIFRKTLEKVRRVTELKADPGNFLKNPLRYLSAPFTALAALPQKARINKPILYGKTTIDQLPLIKSWPMDGGAFVTLPQVCTLPPGGSRNMMQSNIGMYRIQLTGNEYETNKEIGLHYQIHRGIGVHHTLYNQTDEPFKASVFIGGPPSHAFSAIMPMPEGLSEMTFAGMLAGKRFRWLEKQGHILSADADFVITGTIRKSEKKPEGPFGDHLGYYSLEHPFPVMEVDQVYYKKGAIWHFTVVGRPPQEDSSFGYLIHQLVEALTPGEFPGIKSINAVDAAGVHPLLLAVGSERYMPFRGTDARPDASAETGPEEILTQANHLLGKGQTTLAKFVIISNHWDNPQVDAHYIPEFFQHVLERINWERDLHFQTNTSIDTLDYSGSGWNAGSKVIMAAAGPKRRTLGTEIPSNLTLPSGFKNPRVALPGILALEAPDFVPGHRDVQMQLLDEQLGGQDLSGFPLLILTEDSSFVAAHLNNFLWVSFTRANPSHDIHGVKPFIRNKHWGCQGPLIIDARIKPHHAPPLVPDPEVSKQVDRLFAKSGPLYDFR